MPDTVLPAAGEVIETVGGVVSLGVLRTVTLIVAVAVLPAASNAEAVSVTEPSATVVEIGRESCSAGVLVPTSVVLARNSTRVTPTLSVALAGSATMPGTVLPAAGEVIETVGGVVSLDVLRTVTLIVAVAVLPAASNAEAVSVTEPSATMV